MNSSEQPYPILLGPDGLPWFVYKPYKVGFDLTPKETLKGGQ